MGKMTIKNAHRILGITIDRLRQMVKDGKIKPTGFNGGLGGRSMTFNSKDVYALERELKNEGNRRIIIRRTK